MLRIVVAVASLQLLTGCASILSGTTQTITLNTNPPGARCELFREGRVVGTVEKTPGAVTLKKTKHDMDVLCKKDGFAESKEFAKSGTAGATFGNILLGGGIGWAIDSAAGADNFYPEVITVTLNPVSSFPASVPMVPAAPVKAVVASQAIPTEKNKKRLDELKRMKDEGYLTEEEYNKKRSDIVEKL